MVAHVQQIRVKFCQALEADTPTDFCILYQRAVATIQELTST